MQGIIKSATYKEEWDKTSWKIGNEFYSIKGDKRHVLGKEVIFDIYTVPGTGGKHVSGGAFTVSNEHPDPDPDLTTGMPSAPQAQGNGQARTQGRTNKDRWIFMQAIVKSWISSEDNIEDITRKCQSAWVLSGTVGRDKVEAPPIVSPDLTPDPVQSEDQPDEPAW